MNCLALIRILCTCVCTYCGSLPFCYVISSLPFTQILFPFANLLINIIFVDYNVTPILFENLNPLLPPCVSK